MNLAKRAPAHLKWSRIQALRAIAIFAIFFLGGCSRLLSIVDPSAF